MGADSPLVPRQHRIQDEIRTEFVGLSGHSPDADHLAVRGLGNQKAGQDQQYHRMQQQGNHHSDDSLLRPPRLSPTVEDRRWVLAFRGHHHGMTGN